MSEYVDTKLINCNRLASIESRSGNDSNPAIFTNPLEQSIKLDVGDKVSVERAFINELGAGNPQTIEFKGEARGANPVSTYVKVNPQHYYRKMNNVYDPKYRLGYYRAITAEEVSTDEVELRDNLAPLVIGYYITANEYPNYIQHPRRFICAQDSRGGSGRDDPNCYSDKDGFSEGSCRFAINEKCVLFEDWTKRIAEHALNYIYKQRVDNTRYTLYIKDKIAYSKLDDIAGATRIDVSQFPNKYHNGIIQEANYLRYRERLDVEVNKGFNTPSAVASQITQTLTETKNEDIFQVYDGDFNVRSITKTIETNTYKPINSQNIYNVNQTTLAAYTALDIPTSPAFVTQDAIDYIATFGYIAVKRPEIFDQGRRMAKELANSDDQPIIRNADGSVRLGSFEAEEGFQTVFDRPIVATDTTNQDDAVTFNIIYNEKNLGLIRDFFDSQALYPEIWDKLNETDFYGATNLGALELPTIENSRFFHMNLLTTKPGANPRNETFGDDMYVDNGTNEMRHLTAPVFFRYDDAQRDLFVPPTVHNGTVADGLSYGFALPTRFPQYNAAGVRQDDIFLITITNDGVGGIAPDFYSEETTPPTAGFKSIEEGRRVGYDHHASAYSTAIITPYSGYTKCDIGTSLQFQNAAGATFGDHLKFPATTNFIRSQTNFNKVTDFNPYMTMTYIGSNNPEIRYNTETNRFELSRFHTANNIGNKRNANNGASIINSKTQTPTLGYLERNISSPNIDQEAGSTVYKINPRPPQFGFSPTFKPYFRENQAYRTNVFPEAPQEVQQSTAGLNVQKYNGFNAAIEAYKVFDSHGGIYIDNWGFDRDNWDDSLWDILGFDYDATNAPPSSKNVLTKRVDNENSDALYRPTTNAEVVQTDTKNYITNEYGAVQYYTSLPYPSCIVNYKAVEGGTNFLFVTVGDDDGTDRNNPVKQQPLELWSEVDILTQSTSITATNIQKAVLRPYYTIRSDILEGHSAIGGNPTGANLPIISIVDKYSGASDYFLGNPSDLQFTVTKPTILADITTSIHDSDGRYANVNKTSAVIYKVQKLRRTPTDILEDIMQEGEEEMKEKKKKKKN